MNGERGFPLFIQFHMALSKLFEDEDQKRITLG